MYELSTSVGCWERVEHRILRLSRDGTSVAARRRSHPMVHDLVLALVFLSMIVAPALIAMRADNGEQDF